MKLIDISTPKHPNTFTQVDDEDFEWLNQWKWSTYGKDGWLYAARQQMIQGKQTYFALHRVILSPPPNMIADHRDGNGLNNTRSNLRLATRLENSRNRRRVKVGYLSRFKGVTKSRDLWKVQIRYGGRLHVIGPFDSEVEAALVYNQEALKHHGEFASINIIPEGVKL